MMTRNVLLDMDQEEEDDEEDGDIGERGSRRPGAARAGEGSLGCARALSYRILAAGEEAEPCPVAGQGESRGTGVQSREGKGMQPGKHPGAEVSAHKQLLGHFLRLQPGWGFRRTGVQRRA